jgi:TonB family protein
MSEDKVIKIAFLISFTGHCLLLGSAGLNLHLLLQEKKTEVFTVELEIEMPALLPKTDVIGQERKFKEVEKMPEPKPKPQNTLKQTTGQQAPQERIGETGQKSETELKTQNIMERTTGQQVPQERIGEVGQKPGLGQQSQHTLKQTTGQQPLHGGIGEKVDVINTDKVAMLRYQDMVKQRIEEAKRYPLWAKKQGIEGIAYLSFIISRNGNGSGIQIVHSSGSSILDEEAVATVMRAQPFPFVPKEISSSSLRMQVAIVFSLKKN